MKQRRQFENIRYRFLSHVKFTTSTCSIEMTLVLKSMSVDESYTFSMKFTSSNTKHPMLVKRRVKEHIAINNISYLHVSHFHWILCLTFVVRFIASRTHNVNKNTTKGSWDKENYLNYNYGTDTYVYSFICYDINTSLSTSPPPPD